MPENIESNEWYIFYLIAKFPDHWVNMRQNLNFFIFATICQLSKWIYFV